MKWKKIKADCPLSFEKAFQWRHDLTFPSRERSLYDFFDKQGIIIQLFLFDMGEFGVKIYSYEKYTEGNIEPFGEKGNHILDITPVMNEISWDDRSQAEVEAFTEAFKILERELTK